MIASSSEQKYSAEPSLKWLTVSVNFFTRDNSRQQPLLLVPNEDIVTPTRPRSHPSTPSRMDLVAAHSAA